MSAALGWLRTERGRMRVRYVVSSGLSVAAGQLTLAVCFGLLRWPAEASNLVAFVAGGLVSYMLNRRWTWRRSGRSHVWREIAPFWAIAVAGLVASTLAVGFADDHAELVTASRTGQTVVVMAAALGAYGLLWIVKFIVLDRYGFGLSGPAATARPMHMPPPPSRAPR